MRPAELLRLARVHAADVGGRPRWMARNRAASTAYYAVFHALAEFCGRELVGAWKPWPAFRHVYRSLDHGTAKKVLDAARREPTTHVTIKGLGDIFTVLQERRHLADYDPGYSITSADLVALLADADRALTLIANIPAAERKLLAVRLIGKSRS